MKGNTPVPSFKGIETKWQMSTENMSSELKDFSTINTKCSYNKIPQIKTSISDKSNSVDQIHNISEIPEECEEIFFVNGKNDETKIILDTGVTTHTVGNKNLFTEIHSTNRTLNTLNHRIQVSKEGTIKIGPLLVRNVAFVPGARNIISFTKLKDQFDLTWKGDGSHFVFFKEGRKVCSANKIGSQLFINEVNISPDGTQSVQEELSELDKNILEIHIGLGHVSPVDVRKYIEKLSARKIPIRKIQEVIKVCECRSGIGSSVMRKPVYNTPGERIHLDLVGKIGTGYLFMAVDAASLFIVCHILESRTQVTETAISTLKFFQNHLSRNNLSVCSIRISHEFRTKALTQFCLDNGIQVGFTTKTQSLNGEPTYFKPKKILQRIRNILQHGKVPPQYWNFAARHAVFVHNLFTFNQQGLCPWETFNNLRTTISRNFKIPPFGCKITFFNGERIKKTFHKNFNGVFLGFDNTTRRAFVLLPNNKIIKTSSFTMFKNILPFKNKDFYAYRLNLTLHPPVSSRHQLSHTGNIDHNIVNQFEKCKENKTLKCQERIQRRDALVTLPYFAQPTRQQEIHEVTKNSPLTAQNDLDIVMDVEMTDNKQRFSVISKLPPSSVSHMLNKGAGSAFTAAANSTISKVFPLLTTSAPSIQIDTTNIESELVQLPHEIDSTLLTQKSKNSMVKWAKKIKLLFGLVPDESKCAKNPVNITRNIDSSHVNGSHLTQISTKKVKLHFTPPSAESQSTRVGSHHIKQLVLAHSNGTKSSNMKHPAMYGSTSHITFQLPKSKSFALTPDLTTEEAIQRISLPYPITISTADISSVQVTASSHQITQSSSASVTSGKSAISSIRDILITYNALTLNNATSSSETKYIHRTTTDIICATAFSGSNDVVTLATTTPSSKNLLQLESIYSSPEISSEMIINKVTTHMNMDIEPIGPSSSKVIETVDSQLQLIETMDSQLSVKICMLLDEIKHLINVNTETNEASRPKGILIMYIPSQMQSDKCLIQRYTSVLGDFGISQLIIININIFDNLTIDQKNNNILEPVKHVLIHKRAKSMLPQNSEFTPNAKIMLTQKKCEPIFTPLGIMPALRIINHDQDKSINAKTKQITGQLSVLLAKYNPLKGGRASFYY